MQQNNDPPGEPFWLTALFAVLGTLYVLTILLNFWNSASALFG